MPAMPTASEEVTVIRILLSTEEIIGSEPPSVCGAAKIASKHLIRDKFAYKEQKQEISPWG
jgi:hypothetical protein